MSWRRLVASTSQSSSTRRQGFLGWIGRRFNHGSANNQPPNGPQDGSGGPRGRDGPRGAPRGGRNRNKNPAAASQETPAPAVSSRWKFVQAAARLDAIAKKEAADREAADVTTIDIQRPAYVKTKRLSKTAGFIMEIVDKEAIMEVKKQRDVPVLKPGYVVSLKVEIPENKRRVQEYKGIILGIRKKGINTTFRIRRNLGGTYVENVLPLYSPHIKDWKVLEKKRVHRAKLYHIRDGKWKLKTITPRRQRGKRDGPGKDGQPLEQQSQEQSTCPWPAQQEQGADHDSNGEVVHELAAGQN